MTKLANFKINTDITLRDLMDFAEFKLRLAESERNADVSLLLRTQAAELHLICDNLVGSAITNTGAGLSFLPGHMAPTMLSLDGQRVMAMVALTKKALPNFNAVMNPKNKLPFNIEEAKIVVENEPGGEEVTKPKLNSDEGLDLEEVAKLVCTKKYGQNEGDDEYVKMVKDTLIACMKKAVNTDPNSKDYGQPVNGRIEAMRFLKDYAFKSLNWDDTTCHRFLNRLKEVEEIEEPSKKFKQEESERILKGKVE
jgi:hypothetical protein